MKILWLSHFIPYPPKGGNLQRTYHLLREASARHDVHLVALNQARRLDMSETSVATATEALSRFCRSVTVFPMPSQATRASRWWTILAAGATSEPYDVRWLRSDAFATHVRGLAFREPFDLVHLDTIGLAPYASELPPIPVVLNHHNVESDMLAQRATVEQGWLQRAYFRREARKLEDYERAVCPGCAMNLVVSSLDATRLTNVVGGCATAVVENGTDTDYFVPKRPLGHGDGAIIFSGRMNWYPNLAAARQLVREIWPALVRERPERRLMIVGAGSTADLHSAAASDPRITVTGFVDDIRPWLDDASIYVCPIQDGGGTRLKVVDALAMAKPLVATKFAVEGLGLVEDRHFLRAETPDQFVARVRQLEDDPTLRADLARAGRDFVEERFSWHHVGANLESAYRAALR